MSSKISLIIAIFIVVAFGMWWYSGEPKYEIPPAVTVQSSENKTSALQTVIKDSGSSNAALDQDMSAIDKELNSIDVDSTSIDQILATAKKIVNVANSFSIVGKKIQVRIADLQTAGRDVSRLQDLLSDMDLKIADAIMQAQIATSSVASLATDNIGTSTIQANRKIMEEAQSKIKAGNSDLKDARKDAGNIIKELKAIMLRPTATTTPATTTPTSSGSVLSQ